MAMDKKQKVLKWLETNRDVIKISSLGKKSGINSLLAVVNKSKSGKGIPHSLSDKFVDPLIREIKKLKF